MGGTGSGRQNPMNFQIYWNVWSVYGVREGTEEGPTDPHMCAYLAVDKPFVWAIINA